MRCRVACIIEAWDKITEHKPLDLDSPLYDQLDNVIKYYLTRVSNSRASIGLIERGLLPHNGISWKERASGIEKERPYFKFVLKHRLARIIKQYVNIQYYINFCATEQFSSIEEKFGESPSGPFWKAKVDFDQLPMPLRDSKKPNVINSYLKTRIKEAKRKLAHANYLKVDFSTSDLTAFVALSGTILLVLGYLQVAILSTYFGVPYQRYFDVSDYIAASINSIDKYLLGAFIAFVFGYFQIASAESFVLHRASFKHRPLSDRTHIWIWHFTGISSVVALCVVFFTRKLIDPFSLYVAGLYIGMQIIGSISAKFFVNPAKAYLFISLAFIAILGGVDGSIREIYRIEYPESHPTIRTLQFEDKNYSEPEWSVLAITSDFVILRQQSNGLIEVRAKSDLKGVFDVGNVAPIQE